MPASSGVIGCKSCDDCARAAELKASDPWDLYHVRITVDRRVRRLGPTGLS